MDAVTLALVMDKIKNLRTSGAVGYTENTEKVLFRDEKVPFVSNQDYPFYICGLQVDIGDRDSITVSIDDTKCLLARKETTLDGVDEPVIYYGNLGILGVDAGFEDTGEPMFLLKEDATTCKVGYGKSDPNTDETVRYHLVSIAVETETIHPIDPRFLPGVCLPVVELTTVIPLDRSPVELTAEETATLDGVGNTPIILVLTPALSEETTLRTALIASCEFSPITDDDSRDIERYYTAIWWMEKFYTFNIIRLGGNWTAFGGDAITTEES